MVRTFFLLFVTTPAAKRVYFVAISKSQYFFLKSSETVVKTARKFIGVAMAAKGAMPSPNV